MRLCILGLSLESDTGLGPVETDTDSHRPLMSDEEDEVEVYGGQNPADQQPDEPPAESPQAIGFIQACCLPGVLCVSLTLLIPSRRAFCRREKFYTLALCLSVL